MKTQQLYILIANIFLALSFLADGFNRFGLIFVGVLWLLASIFISYSENALDSLQRKLDSIKFDLIVKLLTKLIKKRK